MIEDAILLSVKPKYARRILEGSKTVELRRVAPKIRSGSLVVIYVSSPVKAILGAFFVDKVVSERPEDLWPLVRETAGISREEFDAYYEGAARGVGIFVSSVHTADNPFDLEDLRRIWPEFHPPQGYRYLRKMGDQVEAVLATVAWPVDDSVFGPVGVP